MTSSLTRVILLAACLSNVVFADPPQSASDASQAIASGDVSEANVSAAEALKVLQDGNARFVAGRPTHPHEGKQWRRKLVEGQKPIATILGCSDSRVTPELIFDEGLGDLFVIRVAGNIVDQDVTASIEYAVDHLHTHLIVVLGHENCGAVTAAMQHHDERNPRELVSLVNRIHDTITTPHAGEPNVDASSPVSTAVHKNVLAAVRHLHQSPDLEKSIRKEHVRVVGAIYDLESGRVKWLQ